jgi:hypothetical protein
MKRALILSAVCSAALFAQSGVSVPQIGISVDGCGSARSLFGIAGNFVWGDVLVSGVDSVAYSGTFAIVKTDRAIFILDRQGERIANIDASPGPALFAFAADGSPALAYSGNTLFRWTAGSLEPISLDPSTAAATVVSIYSPDSESAGLILQNDQGLWDIRVNLSSGAVEQQAAIAFTGPTLRLGNGDTVTTDANGIVILHADGNETHLASLVPQNFSLAQIGDGWVELIDSESPAQLAIRVSRGREAIFLLPGVNP